MPQEKPMKLVCEIPYDLPTSKLHVNGPKNGEVQFLGLTTSTEAENARAAKASQFPNYQFYVDEAWDLLPEHPAIAEIARHRGIRRQTS